jgi:glycosyltransferase involved in cell wall biosynthesis
LGYDIADRLGATVVVTMDADGQHQPEEIDRLVEPIIKGNADIVIGSRVIGEREKDSAIRWVGIHFFNTVINILTGLSITDCSSGYRAFRLEKLRKVKLTQDQYHTAELIIDAVKKRMVIVESPITITRRLHGSSKKGTNFWYGFGFLKTVIKTWWR